MKRYILYIALLSFILFGGFLCDHKEEGNPNIIIILADDMGYGDAQCYNPESLIPTPNIDQLAAEGVLFTDAHSSSAVCTPSRYSLLTGQYCWRTSLKRTVLKPWDNPLIQKGRMILPEMLRQCGYQTAAIGKWHLGWEWTSNDTLTVQQGKGENVDYSKPITGGPLDFGFDYYFGDDVPNYPPYTFIENDSVLVVPTVEKPDSIYGWSGLMAPGWNLEDVMPIITDKAVSYIDENSSNEKPFFLYLSLTAPHVPIAPAEPFIGSSKAGLYGDFVYEIDWVVGKIMTALDVNDIDKNTILIFTSDNGSPGRDGKYMSGAIGSVEEYGHHPNGLLRGYKGDIWEAGHRIPFIVRWPSKIEKGKTNNDLFCQVDLMRTISALVGYQLPEYSAEDSYNFLPVFVNESDTTIREALINHSMTGDYAIRKGKWKLILTNRSGGISERLNLAGYGISTPGQLYDLENDIGEQNNLYEEYPDIVFELKQILTKYRLDRRSVPWSPSQNDSINLDPNHNESTIQ